MRIAMLLHKSTEHDSRVRREARALAAAGHEVTVLHLPRVRGEFDGELDGFRIRSVTPSGWIGRRLPRAPQRLLSVLAFIRAVRRLRPDAVHAHDVAMLLPGAVGARLTGADLVYDSHELATGVPYRGSAWEQVVETIEAVSIRRCAAVVTVSNGIAARLQERYGLSRAPVVVRNLPDPDDDDPGYVAPDLRRGLGIDPETPLVLHLGAVATDRGCETLVQAMAEIPEAHLLFLGADDTAYAESLRELAARSAVGERVHLLPSVPVGQIRAHTRQASVGVTLLEDTCENHRLALPNKVFEYLAADVPVVASDLPELRALIASTGAGRTVDSANPGALAASIAKTLDGDVPHRDGLARELSWPADRVVLVDLYAGLARRRERARLS